MQLLVDLQYFPSIILYKILYNFSNIIFEQYESYQKMSFRNRCQVVGAEGVIDLSIPLVRGRDQKTLMKDVGISNAQPWQSQHWKTIVSCYSRSPWFEFYRDELEGLYGKQWNFLLDWNLVCFEWTMKALGISIPVSVTESYEKEYAADKVTDWRGKILPKHLAGGMARPGKGMAGLSEGMAGLRGAGLADSSITGSADEGEARPYRQVFGERIGFIPNLSVLDLLFCEGKQSIRYLRPS
jgi:hypothetical protein